MAFFAFKCNSDHAMVTWKHPVEHRDTGDPYPTSNCWFCGRFGQKGQCCSTGAYAHTVEF